MNFCKFLKVFLGILFCLFIPLKTEAAILSFLPQSQEIYQGDSFMVAVWLDTEGENVNAVEGCLSFPKEKIEAVDIRKGSSILNLWPQEPFFSNEKGEISFVGGLPTGFRGQGQIFSIIFRPVAGLNLPQIVSLSFQKKSKVLLHDGQGTPAKLTLLEGNYSLIKKPRDLPEISSTTHPDQTKWYNHNILHLHWNLREGAEYSYVLSRDPLAEPDEVPDRPEGELIWLGDMEYQGLEDGVYYFHLRESQELDSTVSAGGKEGQKWGLKITFRAMIDTLPPEPFEITIGQNPSIFAGQYFLTFAAVDKTSGIDHFEILETRKGKGKWERGESPYLLKDQSLTSIIKVKAVDKAGNERIAEIVPPLNPFPYRTRILVLIGMLILIGAGGVWWLMRKFMKYKNRIK